MAEARHETIGRADATAHPRRCLRLVLASRISQNLDGRDRGTSRYYETGALSAFPQQGRSDGGGTGLCERLGHETVTRFPAAASSKCHRVHRFVFHSARRLGCETEVFWSW